MLQSVKSAPMRNGKKPNLLFVVNFSTEIATIKQRREAVSVGLNKLRENESIFEKFKQAALTIDRLSDMEHTTMKKIHHILSKHAYNAYTGYR